MDIVTVWEEIPQFTCEHDEAKFWVTHRIEGKLMEQSIINADQAESTSITLRIDPRMLARIKRLARARYLNYQSMMKQWISERMESELRDRGNR